MKLSEEVIAMLKNPDTVKVLGTKDKNGVVHTVFKDSLYVDEDGNLCLLEYLETSQTNRNLTYAIWFHQLVSVTLLSPEKESYQIKGFPKKVYITGKRFEETYREVVSRSEVLDLSGIWVIEPQEIRLETLKPRAEEEREKYPIVGHMDRDYKGE